MLWELTAQTPTKTRGLDKTSRLMGNFICVLHSRAADSSRLRHETDPSFLALKSSFCCLAEFGERIFLPFTNNKVFPWTSEINVLCYCSSHWLPCALVVNIHTVERVKGPVMFAWNGCYCFLLIILNGVAWYYLDDTLTSNFHYLLYYWIMNSPLILLANWWPLIPPSCHVTSKCKLRWSHSRYNLVERVKWFSCLSYIWSGDVSTSIVLLAFRSCSHSGRRWKFIALFMIILQHYITNPWFLKYTILAAAIVEVVFAYI